MQKHKIILKEYLELVLKNLDTYESRLTNETGNITAGEAAYIAKRRLQIQTELTELNEGQSELTNS